MLINIMMALTMYPVVIILFLVERYMGLNHSHYIFGVTATRELRECRELEEIIQRYKRQMKWIFLITLPLPLSAFFFTHSSIQMTIWTFWLFLEVFLVMVPLALAHEKVLARKDSLAGSVEKAEDEICYVELRNVRTVGWRSFLIPILGSFLPVLFLAVSSKSMELGSYQREQMIVYSITDLTLAVTTLLFAAIGLWMDRRRITVVSGDSDTNINYARAKKMVWKRVWLAVSYVNMFVIVVASAAVWYDFHVFMIFLVGLVIESVLTVVFCLIAVSQIGRISMAYEERMDVKQKDDDDHCWKWGFIYYNKSDPRNTVDQRLGLGTTVNMARPAGIASSLVGLIVMLSMPILFGWLIWEDFTPIHLVIRNQEMVCQHTSAYYEIPLDSIVKAEILRELPKDRSKSVGTATDTLEKGRFSTREEGRVYECLNPQNGVFLRVETADRIYYVNGYSDAETAEIGAQLQQVIE